MAKRLHRSTPATENHVLQRWEVANAAARLALVPGSADLGGVARQADDGSLWSLKTISPTTWRQLDPDQAEFAAPAVAAQAAAEAARDAATATGKVYADTAAGIAAVADGAFFSVPVAGGVDSFIVYQRVGAAAVEKTRLPSTARVDQVGRIDEYPEYYWALTDSSGRLALGVKKDGSVYIAKALQETLGFGGMTLDGSWSQTGRLFAIVDAAGRVGLEVADDGTITGKIVPTETVTARGTRDSLDARLSVGLTAYGHPKRHTWGEWYLRETRQRLRLRALGETAQLVAAFIGDSWTHGASTYIAKVWSTLQTAFGDAGTGWCGLAFGAAGGTQINGSVAYPTQAVGYTTAANWTYSGLYNATASPDLASISSAVVGAQVNVTGGPASCSAVKLFYIGTGGVVRYRWNGGGWTSLTLSGSGLQIATLTGLPAGAWTLDLEVVSGTVQVCGLDVQKSGSGVRVHKLGGTGSSAANWAAVTAADWQAGITALDPRLVAICLATNDQGSYTAAVFKPYVQTIIDRVRAAVPQADILLIAPCENGLGRANAMSSYADALRELAAENKCAFLDLQHLFGEAYADYAYGSARPWFSSDNVHPDPTSGGRAITDALIRLLTQAT